MGQLIADAVSHSLADAINRGPMLNESSSGCVYARQRVCGVSRVIQLLATTAGETASASLRSKSPTIASAWVATVHPKSPMLCGPIALI